MRGAGKVSITLGEEKAIRPDAVAIYVRWSTEEQGEGTTLQEQLERGKAYLTSQGWQVNPNLIFIDDGYSGATLDRPAITRLRAMVRKGQVDCVVSLKIDRLSRSLVDCVELVLREWAGTCHYKSVSQPVNTTDALGRVFFAVLAGFAEYERALIRERTFSGLIRRVKDGGAWGSGKPPYGYCRVSRGKLAINPEEAGVVRLIFGLVVDERLGPSAIAARLNNMGISGPEGKGWWAHTIRNLLKAKIYTGCPEFGRRYWAQKPDGKKVLTRRAQPLVEPARAPELAIVSTATYEAAQRVLAEWSAKVKDQGARVKASHLLTGLLRCRCGGRMITGYDRLGRRYYRCPNKEMARGGVGCSTAGGFVYAHLIEPVVADEVMKRFADREAMVAHVRERWEREQSQGRLAGEAVRQRLAELGRLAERLEHDLARVVRQARKGEISLEEKRAFEADIEAERIDILAQRDALERQVSQQESTQEGWEALLDWVVKTDPWSELSLETQKELLGWLLEYLEVYKPKGKGMVPEVDFYWRV